MSTNPSYVAATSAADQRFRIPFKTAFLSIISTVATWQQRARDRRHLRDLELHLLDDINMSPARRNREVRKPFWVR